MVALAPSAANVITVPSGYASAALMVRAPLPLMHFCASASTVVYPELAKLIGMPANSCGSAGCAKVRTQAVVGTTVEFSAAGGGFSIFNPLVRVAKPSAALSHSCGGGVPAVPTLNH